MRKLMIAVAVLLVACGAKLEGSYMASTPVGPASITFEDGGHAALTALGQRIAAQYELSGDDQIRLIVGGQVQMLSILPDGALRDVSGMIYRKQ